MIPPITGGGVMISAGGLFTVLLQEGDCDNDGLVDAAALANGLKLDHNGNQSPDLCDVAHGWEEDCDGNEVIDSYQRQLNAQIVVSSEQLGPFGYNAPRSTSYAAAPYSISDVLLTVRVLGDFSEARESLTVTMNGRFIGTLFGNRYDYDCIEREDEIFIPMDLFNEAIWSPSGSLDANFEFRASIAVNANQCPTGSWVQASLTYAGAITEDCNANGLLDVCEVRDFPETDTNGNGVCDACEGIGGSPFCHGDLDGDRQVDAGDIGTLLTQFGTAMPGAPADLDGDGAISSSDIGALLTLFGPC